MKVKRFEAETMQEAIAKVKADLGRDAVILHSKKFRRGGIFGLFGRQVVEVIAAVDVSARASVAQERKLEGAKAVEAAANSGVAPAFQPLFPRTEATAKPLLAVVPGVKTATLENRNTESALQNELLMMRKMLQQVTTQLRESGTLPHISPAWDKIRKTLLANEIAAEHVMGIEEAILRQLDEAAWQNDEAVSHLVRSQVADIFSVGARNQTARAGIRRVIALVGPTGVGKTTTVAKLAAHAALVTKKDVGLITADTYRIAAVEQLKTYAEIIGIPIEIAFTPPELKMALARMANKELVFIDTAGRSQHNEQQMAELLAFLAAANPDETHLVLSATTKLADLRECIEHFQPAKYNWLIFTKLDETSSYGCIFNSVLETRCPVSYLSIGQNVPDDIEEADSARLTGLLLGGMPR